MVTSLDEFMREYERCTNTHRFEMVAPLIDADAVYWFTDGSFRGRAAIRDAFERTWAVIQDETYHISNVEWLIQCTDSAACIYTFHWQGRVGGAIRQVTGRGTCMLRRDGNRWVVVHEHLSRFPE